MYIEFRLPTGSGGFAAHFYRRIIDTEVRNWAKKYNIEFKTKTVKYSFRVILNSAEEYTLFGISFSPNYKNYSECLTTWRFVEPMSVDKTK